MSRYTFSILYLLFICISIRQASAQFIPYHFQQLSGIAYRQLGDSLNKNWKCPKVFTDKKTQKEYEYSWDLRSKRLVAAIRDNNFVKDSVLYPYLEQIMNEIIIANKTMIPYKVHLFLDRTNIPNAYSIGGHIIAVNAGIVIQSNYKEELALYIAHELSHDLLEHSDSARRKRAVLLNSDDYKNSLKDVLSSKYQRYSKLKQVMEDYSFDHSRHSRYNEQSADSLAIILLKNSKISFDAAYFLNLDTMDNRYKTALSQPLKSHFEGLDINDNSTPRKTKGLSAMTFNFKDTTHTEDSLKTHPDCKDRYAHNLVQSDIAAIHTPIPATIHNQAFYIAQTSMFMNNNIGHACYILLQEKEKNKEFADYFFLFGNLMYGLQHSIQEMNRFNSLGIEKKEDVSKSYFDMQYLLEHITASELAGYCSRLDTRLINKSPEQEDFRHFLATVVNAPQQEKVTLASNAAKTFNKNYPSSYLIEYTNQFIK